MLDSSAGDNRELVTSVLVYDMEEDVKIRGEKIAQIEKDAKIINEIAIDMKSEIVKQGEALN